MLTSPNFFDLIFLLQDRTLPKNEKLLTPHSHGLRSTARNALQQFRLRRHQLANSVLKTGHRLDQP